LSIDAAIVATADYLALILPTVPADNIVRGQANGSPPPLPPSIVLTEILQAQYTTTRTKLNGTTGLMAYSMPKRLDVQLDFYGITAGDMSSAAVTLLRSLHAGENFPDGYEPLYCSDPLQAPLTTGEKQYETRWSVTFSMQYNAPVSVAQESFITVGETIVDPVDVTIPVE